jgi:hypothetical protein
MNVKWNFYYSLSGVVGQSIDSKQLAGVLDWVIGIDGSGGFVEN